MGIPEKNRDDIWPSIIYSLGGAGAERGDGNGAQQSGAVPPIDLKLSDSGGLARRLRGGLCGEQPT